MGNETRVPIINANACGIDVGSRAHYVAVGQGCEAVGALEFTPKTTT